MSFPLSGLSLRTAFYPRNEINFSVRPGISRSEAKDNVYLNTPNTKTLHSRIYDPERWWKGFFRLQAVKYVSAPLVALRDLDPRMGIIPWAISRGSGILSSTCQAGQGTAQINTKKYQEGKTTIARASLQFTSDVLGLSASLVINLALGICASGVGVLASAASIYKYTEDLKKNGSEIKKINQILTSLKEVNEQNTLTLNQKLKAIKLDSLAQRIAIASRAATGVSNLIIAAALPTGLLVAGFAGLTSNPAGWAILGLLSLAAVTMIISTVIRLYIRNDYKLDISSIILK